MMNWTRYKNTRLYLSDCALYIKRCGTRVEFNYNSIIRVRHTKDKIILITNIKPKTHGYRMIDDLYVHRIIGEIQIPNPENKPEINHKDSVRSNCHPSNLEWVTAQENVIHGWKAGRVHKLPFRTKEHSDKIWISRRKNLKLKQNNEN